MRLRPALTGLCALALLAGAAPATAADDVADVTLVVTTEGTPQTWSALGVPVGAGQELVGTGAGPCAVAGLVDIDPVARTISVTVARAATSADVTLTVASDAIGGLAVVTPGLSGVALTATPEIAIISWRAAAAPGAECSTETAVFRYVAPGEPLLPADPPLGGVTPGAPTSPPAAGAANAVVADPAFTG